MQMSPKARSQMMPASDEIDQAALAEAEATLRALAAEYPGYAALDVGQMDLALSALEAAGGRDAARVAEIHGAAHNIKGQGSAFGYELMTLLGEALCGLTRDRERLDALALARARALVTACRTVLDERLTGDGGVYGARIFANLNLASETGRA